MIACACRMNEWLIFLWSFGSTLGIVGYIYAVWVKP